MKTLENDIGWESMRIDEHRAGSMREGYGGPKNASENGKCRSTERMKTTYVFNIRSYRIPVWGLALDS